MSEYPKAEIGVFGGSGFYELLDNPRELKVNTPYGAPSSALTVGEIGSRTVAFFHGTEGITRFPRTRSTIERICGR